MLTDDPGRRVVVLSGSADPDDIAKAEAAGACGYLTKEHIADRLVPGVLAAAAV
jgi:DNA-binding NarL/FixJ family response regulator